MATREKRQTIFLEDAEIRFRNFSGKEGQFNREGDRNFAVFLPTEIAEEMKTEGWNVKLLQPREEGDAPQAYIQVAVNFSGDFPPQVVMVTSRGRTNLGEDEVNILDWAEVRSADVIITPYHWAVSGKTGTKAYLHKLYVTIEEDEIDLKYSNVPDSAQNCVGDECEV